MPNITTRAVGQSEFDVASGFGALGLTGGSSRNSTGRKKTSFAKNRITPTMMSWVVRSSPNWGPAQSLRTATRAIMIAIKLIDTAVRLVRVAMPRFYSAGPMAEIGFRPAYDSDCGLLHDHQPR